MPGVLFGGKVVPGDENTQSLVRLQEDHEQIAPDSESMRKAIVNGPIIPPGCEGKTLCDIKPADYPQEEIDNYFINNPDFHKRLKREFLSENLNPMLLAEQSIKKNCEIKVELSAPYPKVTDPSKLPKVIVQSQYFQQKILQVTCNPSIYTKNSEYQCFGDLVQNNRRTRCIQKTRNHKLVVYDREKDKMEKIEGIINVDCICDATDA